MIKEIKKMVGFNTGSSKVIKDDIDSNPLPSGKHSLNQTNYVDNRTYVTKVYAKNSVFTRPNIGTSNPNESFKSATENDSMDISRRKNETKTQNMNTRKEKKSCNPNCPCWGKNITKPKVCPLCEHVFNGKGWEGIDAHYKAKHEKDTGVPYREWWGNMCDEHRKGK